MPKFHLYGAVVGSKYLGLVEAETKEKAIRQVEAGAHVSLCHHCASECEDPQIETITAEEAT